jgi:trimethylamine--corrinoid protein Co-methyltransferase
LISKKIKELFMTELIVKVLNEKTKSKILAEALQVLNKPGVKIENEAALNLIAEYGGKIDRSKMIAHIPEEIVYNALKTVPEEFDLFDLDGTPTVKYGRENIHFDPGSTAIFYLDPKTQKHRQALTVDLINFVKTVEMLPQIDAQSTAFICSDVPEEMGDWYRLYIALNFMNKPIITGAFGKETWWIMKEMLTVVSGGDQELASKPIAVFDVCPSPPLSWSDLTCQNLIDCANARIPAELVSMPLAGATAPVTLAGAVVQHTAENLSGIVIHQLSNPGAPVIWGGSPSIFDMKNGTTPMGAAGTWLIDAAYVEMGKSLNIPTHVYMGMSDAKILDAQCGFESMGGALAAALTGANMISGAGMLDFESCQSLEKLVIDAEIIGLAKRFVQGVQERDDPIGMTLIHEMGHHSGYLSNPHTRKWYKDEFYIPSEIIDRGSYDAWELSGTKTVDDRASVRVEKLVQSYQQPALDEVVRTELEKIAELEASKYGLESLPYSFNNPKM